MVNRRVHWGLFVIALLATVTAIPLNAFDGFLRGSVGSVKKSKLYSASTPVVHHVGLWPHQDDFTVTELRVERYGEMRASQPEASVRFTVEGVIQQGRQVKEFFVREQFRNLQDGRRIVEIVVVPVIEAQTVRADAPSESRVSATAEYTLHQYQWPNNDYAIVCGRLAREVRFRYPE